MVNMALVLENRSGVMERNHKLVRYHQPSSSHSCSQGRVGASASAPRCYILSWTCIPSCVATVAAKATGS
jgi:hypothetical protein